MQVRHLVPGALALALAVVALPAMGATAPTFELSLESRTFVPEPGVEAAREYLRARPAAEGHVLVQLRNPGDASERRVLEGLGVELVQYLPRDTWVARVPADVLEGMGSELLRWAAPLEPADRLHRRLREAEPPVYARTADGRYRLIVRFWRDVAVDEARAVLAGMDAAIETEVDFLRSFDVVVAPEHLQTLAEHDLVQWVQEGNPPKITMNDSNRENVGADTLNDPPYDLDGDGVTAAVWDSGALDSTHPDFGARLTVADGASPTNHATHVGGTLGGNGINSQSHGGSQRQWAGMAPGTTLISYDWTNPVAEHDEAINVYGASISQNSWSFTIDEGDFDNCDSYGDYDANAANYDDLVRGVVGGPLVLCWSAGNERDDGDCGMMGFPYENYGVIGPPATAKNNICVGAIRSDTDGMADFSSWGPMDDGRLKPDLVGPGSQASDDFGVTSTFPGGGYGTYSGTSMSTPTVSGIVALLQQAYQDSLGSLAAPALIKALLCNTARDLGRTGPDYAFGHGAVDAVAALAQLQEGSVVTSELADEVDVAEFEFDVQPGDDRAQVTLCWIDPPASPGATETLINDLDLVLVDPLGGEHLPWRLSPAVPAADAVRAANHRDPVEQVTVDDPTPGTWLARVTATDLPDGPQAFALAGTSPEPPCAGSVILVPDTFSTIQAAVNAAGYCDTVLVGPGTYEEMITISERVILVAENGPGVTTIQAPFFQKAMILENDAIVDGFTFTGGASFGGYPAGYGAAMFIEGVSPTVKNCVFTTNIAGNAGGAVFALGGTPRFEACVFDSNLTQGDGAAIALQNPNGAIITGNVFFDGEAESEGGAVHVQGGSASITNNTFAQNLAGEAGGAVFVTSSATVDFSNNIVAGNDAPSAGGVRCTASTTLACNDFWNNGEDTVDCAAGTGDFAADPDFCDAAADDYRIPLDSPCAPDQTGGCGLVGALDPVECEVVAVDDPVAGLPTVFGVQSVIRGADGVTRVSLDLPEAADVRLSVYDVSGRLVRDAHRGRLEAGTKLLVWDGTSAAGARVASGLYFLEVVTGAGQRVTEKLVLTR